MRGEPHLAAAPAAERVDAVDVGACREGQAVDVILAAAAVGVVNLHAVGAVRRGGEMHQGVGAEGVVVLGEDTALDIEYPQPRVERGADPGGVDLGGDRL